MSQSSPIAVWFGAHSVPLTSPSPTERALRGEWSGDGKVRRGTEAGKNRTRRKQGDPIQRLSSRSPLSHLRILASSHHMPLSERHEVSERHVMTGTTRERSIIARLTASMSLLASGSVSLSGLFTSTSGSGASPEGGDPRRIEDKIDSVPFLLSLHLSSSSFTVLRSSGALRAPLRG